MGYIRHDAIILTSFKSSHLDEARNKAEALGLPVTSITESKLNGYVSCLIVPDGSKEGWEDSENGDDARAKFKEWAKEAEAIGIYFDWVHVSYAGDESGDTRIVEQGRQ